MKLKTSLDCALWSLNYKLTLGYPPEFLLELKISLKNFKEIRNYFEKIRKTFKKCDMKLATPATLRSHIRSIHEGWDLFLRTFKVLCKMVFCIDFILKETVSHIFCLLAKLRLTFTHSLWDLKILKIFF